MDLDRNVEEQYAALSDQNQALRADLLSIWKRMDAFDQDKARGEQEAHLRAPAEPADPVDVQTNLEETIGRILETRHESMKQDLTQTMQ